MLSFKSFSAESFTLDGNILTINYGQASSTNKLTFGKGNLKPYVKKLDGIDVQVRCLYTFKDKAGTDLMKKLKSGDIDKNTYDQFLQRSSVFATRLLRDFKIDLIVLPESSSPLAADFVERLLASNPGIRLAPQNYIKARDINQISLDLNNPKLTPLILKSLQSILRRAKREGVIKMKWVLPQHRKFLMNVFSYAGNSAIFCDKNILIVDDIITSGSSILPIYKSVEEAGAAAVSCLTIFKSST